MSLENLSFDLLHPSPLLIVISGSSGVGKDAVLKGLKQRDVPLHFVITATSRKMRPGEVDGKDYFFYSKEEFVERLNRGEFIEHALVYEDYKGIPRSQIEDALSSNRDVIIRVDVQGAATLRQLYPQSILIFLVPRTVKEWYNRLSLRNSETPESLKVRVDTARAEVEQIHLFDYIVVNADGQLEKAVDDIIAIINAEHHCVRHRKLLE